MRGDAGRRGYRAGDQQGGGVLKKRFEKSGHILKLLTHSGYLARKNLHLVQMYRNKTEFTLGQMFTHSMTFAVIYLGKNL